MTRRWAAVLTALAAVAVLAAGCEELDTSAPEGGSRPAGVYVEDRTGSAWPVRGAVAVWAAAGVPVVYGACPRRARCVRVEEVRRLGGDRGGETSVFGSPVVVRLAATEAGAPAAWRAWIVRHELGHALGLGHSGDPADLMYPSWRPGQRTAPTAAQAARARK